MSQMVHAPPVLGLTTQLKKQNQTINAKLYKPNYIFTGKCWQCCHVHRITVGGGGQHDRQPQDVSSSSAAQLSLIHL